MPNAVFVIPTPSVPSLPIEGTEQRFPVHRIYCIGRNYGKHVQEMGGDPKDQPPIFFMKPADAAFPACDGAPYPPGTDKFHHEVELVVALKAGGADVSSENALDLIYGYAVGIDLTRRDLQNEAKDKGQPWDSAKGFDASAPTGLIRPAAQCGPLDGRITISVNGQTKQDGQLSDMIWGVAEIISEISKLWTLKAGDLIFTGTPDGVGPLQRGDQVEGEIAGVGTIAFKVL
jgi:fumarylpyruvate hydrolase